MSLRCFCDACHREIDHEIRFWSLGREDKEGPTGEDFHHFCGLACVTAWAAEKLAAEPETTRKADGPS